MFHFMQMMQPFLLLLSLPNIVHVEKGNYVKNVFSFINIKYLLDEVVNHT